MANILITIFTFLLMVICIFLVFVVLLQRANTNAGLGTAFGGGIAESTFGANTGNILTRSTIVASCAFFIISFGLYLGYILKSENMGNGGELLPELSSQPLPIQIDESSYDSVLSDPAIQSFPDGTKSGDILLVEPSPKVEDSLAN